jgi:serine/threonine protein kinase
MDLVGKKLGDYKIERQIATGGMATIYLGVDEKLGRQSAVKVLFPDIASRDNTLTLRFEREARAIAQLEHENIVPLYQYGQQDDLYFLAMRYVQGEDLASILEGYQKDQQLMPTERAIPILEQVAAALDYAHTKGIIHRDVKPSNVLLTSDDRAFVADFGLVLYESGDKTLGTAFGTPRYISPEQATDSQLANAKSDIYSLAVIVYEIVTGQRLFKGKTPMEIALSHITEPPLPPRAINPAIPPEVQQVILRSLEKEPDKRHPTAKAFVADLRQAFERAKPMPQPSQEPTLVDTPAIRSDVGATLPLKPANSIATSIPSPKPINPTQETPKNNNLIRNGGLAAVVFVVFLVLFVLPNMNNPAPATPTATSPAVANTSAPAITGDFQLRYTPELFVLINTTQNEQSISNIGLVGSGDDDAVADLAVRLGSTTIAPQGCVVLKAGSSAGNVPASWGCQSTREIVLNTTNLFWRADSTTDQQFTATFSDGQRTCQTVGRAVERLGDADC